MSQTTQQSLLNKLLLLTLLSFAFFYQGTAQANNHQVAAGGYFTCALDDGGVVCWGNSIAVPRLSNPSQVTAGNFHACALDDSGVVCWGQDSNGDTTVPSLSNPSQVAAGRDHNCALDDSGVVCWGSDEGGQVSRTPRLSKPRQVTAGWLHTCALDDSGVVCWGNDAHGQSTVPSLSNPSQVTAGNFHACALDDSGVVCWGQDDYGQRTVPSLSNPSQVTAGDEHTCALDDSGVVCWGNDAHGQVSATPSLSNPSQITAGRRHSCVLDDSGVVCWGDGTYGQVPAVPSLSNPSQVATGWLNTCALDVNGVFCWGGGDGQATVPSLSNPSQVAAGWLHNCALDDSGVVCWGNDAHDQVSATPSLSNPSQVTAGLFHSCVLDDNNVLCWGMDDYGQTTVPSLSNPSQVTAGGYHSCALDDSGVVCWGQDDYGQSTAVPSLSNPSQVTAGAYHSCALDDSGVVCWGQDDYGQSTAVPSLSNPSQIATGWLHTCALDDSGVVCWGDGTYGQATVLNFSAQISSPVITEGIIDPELTFTVTLSAPLEAGQGVFINFDNQQGGWFTQTNDGGHIPLTHQGGNVYATTTSLNKPGIRFVRAGVFALNGSGKADDVLQGGYSAGTSCTLDSCLAAVTRADSYGNPAITGSGSQLFKQVDVANGNYHLATIDISVPGKGPSFAFSRAYNSLADQKWSFGYEMKAQFFDDVDRDGVTVHSTDRRLVIGPMEDGRLLHYFKDLNELGGNWHTFTPGNFQQLVENADGSFTLYSQGNRVYNFADPHLTNGANAGQLQSIQDRLDNTLSFSYSAGNLTAVTDANGRAYTITRDGSNRIQRVTDFSGRYVQYSYNSNNMLTQVRDMRGGLEQYNYVGTSGANRYRIRSINDPRSNIPLTIAYNGSGQVSSLTDAYARVTSFDYKLLDISSGAFAVLDGKQATLIAQPSVGTVNHNLVFVLNDERTRIEERLDAQNADNYRTKKRYQTITSRVQLAEQSLVTRMVEPENINVSNEALEKGTVIIYHATAKGRPTDITDANGDKSTATYAAIEAQQNLHVTATTKQAGVSTATQYSSFTSTGKARTIVDPRSFTRSRVFNGNDWLTKSTNARNNSTDYTYDIYGQVKTITDSANNQTARDYDTLGRVIKETSPLGLETRYTYDANGNVLTQTELKPGTSINYTTKYFYDANNNLTKIIDPKNNITNYVYDKLNRKIWESYTVASVQHTRSYGYDEMGQLKRVTNERGKSTKTYYDERSQVSSKVNPLNTTTVSYGYDKNGNITTVTDAEGRTVTTTYDVINRKTRAQDNKGNYQTWDYNTAGQVASHTDEREETTYYLYDAMGNVTQVTDPRGGVTSSTYDGNGNVLTVNDPNGQTTSYSYDNLDRRTRTTLNNGQYWAYSYDVNGNLLIETTPTGEQTINVYDALNRITQLTEKTAGGSVTRQISYNYDANSNVTSETSGGNNISYSYDEVNRVNSVTDQYGKTIAYGYDKAGNRTTLTYPGNKVINYTYDANDRLDTLTDWLNKTTDYTRNNAGQITQVINGNGTKTQYGYETQTGRLTSLVNKKPNNSTISSHSLTLDGAGNITHATANLPLQPVLPNSITSASTSYNNNNRLLTMAGNSYSHDDSGRIIEENAAGIQTFYNFDINNHITSITRNGSTLSSYGYDLNNNRISQTQNGTVTRYVIDQLARLPNVIAETNSSGSINRYYIYGEGLVSQIDSSNNSHYYHFDPTGHTLALTNASGNVTDKYAYAPYGKTTTQGSTPNPFKYVGKHGVMDDGNGLHYMRARYYKEDIKRFVSLDALHGDIMTPQALNRYAYVLGNPVMGVDPSGYKSCFLYLFFCEKDNDDLVDDISSTLDDAKSVAEVSGYIQDYLIANDHYAFLSDIRESLEKMSGVLDSFKKVSSASDKYNDVIEYSEKVNDENIANADGLVLLRVFENFHEYLPDPIKNNILGLNSIKLGTFTKSAAVNWTSAKGVQGYSYKYQACLEAGKGSIECEVFDLYPK